MRLSDRVTGLFLVALGAVAALAGSRLPPVPGQQIGPNVFPVVVGLGMLLCGALSALGVGRHYEAEAEADLAKIAAAHGEAANGPVTWRRGAMALIPPALLLFYVLLVDRLGFLSSAVILVLAYYS